MLPLGFLRLYLSGIAAAQRSSAADRALATVLAAIAGCANAGGFILLGHYTSHMTGYLSQVADQAVLGDWLLVSIGFLALAMFLAGATVATVLIRWARVRCPRWQYALPLGVQGTLFLVLAALGVSGGVGTLALLCFIMGGQNATITKISGSVIRTTHVTGMVTDTGIELGRHLVARILPDAGGVPDSAKLWLLVRLICVFLVGGVVGALGYSMTGPVFSVPLAAVLLGLAALARPMK